MGQAAVFQLVEQVHHQGGHAPRSHGFIEPLSGGGRSLEAGQPGLCLGFARLERGVGGFELGASRAQSLLPVTPTGLDQVLIGAFLLPVHAAFVLASERLHAGQLGQDGLGSMTWRAASSGRGR